MTLQSNRGKKLTLRREKFCLAYIEMGNGTQAAIKAGYSPHTANEQAAELLALPSVRQRVDKLRQSLTSKRVMSIQERRERLTELAKSKNFPIPAIQELNRMDGAYQDKLRLEGLITVHVDKEKWAKRQVDAQSAIPEAGDAEKVPSSEKDEG